MSGEFCHLCTELFDNESDLQRHLTTVHGQVSQKVQCLKCNRTFSRKNQLKAHIESVHREGAQSLSVILARSRFQTPAIFKDTWPLPRIQELTNHRKENARDLQRQHVLQLTSGELLQVRFFQVMFENVESVVMILPVFAGA